MNAITLSNVDYFINHSFILEDINLEINEGCYLGIIGPNGAGKTTLLRLILGIIKPNRGQVLLYGQNPADYLKKESVGYLPQRISQTIYEFPITVEELVRSGYDKISKDNFEWALNVFRISQLRKKTMRELSGGERQKAFLARAIASKPRILLLDEPTTGIDPNSRDELLQILEILNRDFCITILTVTHDIGTFAHEARCILCLNRKVVCFGDPQKILKDEYMGMLYPEHTVFPHNHA
ncbi:MAG TPA: metal ABC transporter ATP-binding protein [Thermodesulfovibrio thiophilus]|uniref:metal ABC transporter ATP-binding protein n=1 Tax=Thermodesulfovibrio thiophilus TaxID=340095 RepID=UPI0004191D7F|nr:metal ABC transporter ATP-binding protein [Thermodesulfovibrio thiophilus]HQA03510.1 metal ABC transporter ATP-binding protein [Thermodesulfovibrio thiophilus]